MPTTAELAEYHPATPSSATHKAALNLYSSDAFLESERWIFRLIKGFGSHLYVTMVLNLKFSY